ncbi:MAG TPA: DUF2304 domain-containing protein [Acidobacteriota bacterium]|nr:DUF2304 domain-containing protein [Acidobacteriota bacterium]
MIQITSIFFVIFCITIIMYMFSIIKTGKRMPIIFELFFATIFSAIAILFLFPSILPRLELALGLSSAINFIIYTSIFVAYFLLFVVYRENEKHRIEITKLTQQVSFLQAEFEAKKKK